MFFGHYSAIFDLSGAEIFYANSRDYYLSIGVNKSRFRALFAIFDILGPKKGRGPLMQIVKTVLQIPKLQMV